MSESFQKGDRVKWKSAGKEVIGEVEEKLTEPTDIKGHHVAASDSNPEYRVKSEKTGSEAAHKPESLEKVTE
ncbi:MAG: hypothetical protein N5P05_002626 [Chroococcopsis gigantea SAG 12.99]|jgi:hypothetical protein|nr:hypothetical protein [Chroococcopsis gigantea SAG 12.99]